MGLREASRNENSPVETKKTTCWSCESWLPIWASYSSRKPRRGAIGTVVCRHGRYVVWSYSRGCNGHGVCHCIQNRLRPNFQGRPCQQRVVQRFYGSASYSHTACTPAIVLWASCLFKQGNGRRFFAKLEAIYGWLNLIAKSSQIYNRQNRGYYWPSSKIAKI